MPHLADEELIQRAKNGDKEAYRELFDRYSGKILSYLYRYIGDYQVAEDTTIETFLDIYYRLPDYREEGKFLPWLYTIARNFAKKEFRKRKRVKEVSLHEPVASDPDSSIGDLLADNTARPDDVAITDELCKALEAIIAGLDEKYKNAILLCDIEGLSYEEAASILKCNKLTIGVRLNRARTFLYQALKKRGYNF